MPAWTLEERFALWHLFNDNNLDWKDPEWWTIYQEVTTEKRTLEKVWDDYRQRNNPSRGGMYRSVIMKGNHTPAQASIYESACTKVHAAAKRHGIKLSAKPFRVSDDEQDSEDEMDVDDDDHSGADDDEDGDDGSDEQNEGDDGDGDVGMEEDDGNENDSEAEGNITPVSMAAPTSQTSMQQPKPQSKPQARAGNATNRQASIANRKALEAQHELFVEVNEDINQRGAHPPKDSAVNNLLAQVDYVTAKQSADEWLSTPGNVDSEVRQASQKRKLDTWDQLPTTKTSHASLPDVENSDRRKEEHLNKKSKTNTASASTAKKVRAGVTVEEAPRPKLKGILKHAAAKDGQRQNGTSSDNGVQDVNANSGRMNISDTATQEALQQPVDRQKSTDRSTKTHIEQSDSLEPDDGNTRNLSNDVRISPANAMQAPAVATPTMCQQDAPSSSAEAAQAPAVTIPIINQLMLLAEDRSEAFNHWWQVELNRIFIGPAYDLFPTSPKIPHAELDEPINPPRPVDRLVGFFMHMYSGRPIEKGVREIIRSHLANKDLVDKVSAIHYDLRYHMAQGNIVPNYELADVFTSTISPFSNFRLAASAFSQGLQMLHTNDVDFTGPAEQQLAVFAKSSKRHLTADDIDFVDHDEPAFKRGGRVHKLYIRQQECPILGEHKKWNTAYVCIDVMLCQRDECETCSTFPGGPHKSITSLPRVHKRHTKGNNVVGAADSFHEEPVMTSLRHNKEKDERFMVNLASGVVPLTFWDGKTQDVVLCDPHLCLGCREMRGLKPEVELD